MKQKVNTSSQTVRTCDVFISYRREGGDMTAMYFYQALKERGYRVFYDLEVLRAGKFNEALLQSIQSCKDFVVILSPHALDRCNDENDWVRREIAEALRTKKNIVPVMLKGFSFPETLPDDIDDIHYQNGLTCTTEYFEESINRLCERYLNSLPEKQKKGLNPLIPVLAAIAVLAVAVGGFMAMTGKRVQTPEPTPTAAITEAPTATSAATATPEPTATATPEVTEAPTATPEPTEAPGPQVVKDTDFPMLFRGMDTVPGATDFDAEDYIEKISSAPVFNIQQAVTRRDICSITFLPSLEGAPQDAADASEAADRRVLAWVTEAHDGMYDLFIAGDGGVKIPERDDDAYAPLFSGYINLEKVDFNGCVDFSERTNLGRLFWCCNHLKEVNFEGVYTGSAISFSGTFGGCWALEAVDLSGFDTSRAETFDGMFLDCEKLATLDVTGFDTHRCLNMESMFIGCRSLKSLDVSGFDTSRVEHMEYMFANCVSLESLDLSGFDTAHVANMEGMFRGCEALDTLDLSSFDTSRVTNMKEMFLECRRLVELDLSSFNTERVIDMFGMFQSCESLPRLDIGHFNTSRLEDMACMFFDCFKLDDLDLSGWDTSRVVTMSHTFAVCESLYRIDLSNWKTDNVTNMGVMFSMCRHMVEANLSGWNIHKVESMERMFEECWELETIGRDPIAFQHGKITGMYDGCDKLLTEQ